MPNYEYTCDQCETVTIHFRSFERRHEKAECLCGAEASYTISAPALMQASYPDGTRRKGFQDMREAAKLSTEAASAKQGTKKEIAGEIRKLGIRVSKE